MSASGRRILQRAGLALLCVLVLAVGASSFTFVTFEQPDHPHPDREQIKRETRDDVVRSVRTDDILFEESFTVEKGAELAVDLGAERVEILPARGYQATVTVRGEGRDAKREFERRRFGVRNSANMLEVRTDPPRSTRMRSINARFVVTIRIPVEFNASVDVGSGSVRVEELRGDLNIDTGSGAISVGSARGQRIVLKTGSGSIQAEMLSGSIDANTGSGSIRVNTAKGSFEADTGSGSIRVDDADVDRFAADTGSGSVFAHLARSAEVNIDTGSGRVELVLPRASGADVDLRGRPIRIDEVLNFQGNTDRNSARGQLGRGGPGIDIETNSGGIIINAD